MAELGPMPTGHEIETSEAINPLAYEDLALRADVERRTGLGGSWKRVDIWMIYTVKRTVT